MTRLERFSATVGFTRGAVIPIRSAGPVWPSPARTLTAGRLTGDPQGIWPLMGDALRFPFMAGRTATPTIAHTGGLLLVDRDLMVRGFYGGEDPTELQALRQEATTLLHKRQLAVQRP